MSETCGAKCADGTPCEREVREGRCHTHAADGQNPQAREHTSRKYDPGDMAQALLAACGVVEDVAKRLGCSTNTVYRYIREFPACDKAKKRGRMRAVDEARGTVIERLRSDDADKAYDAAKFIIRQYDTETVRNSEIDHTDGGMEHEDPQVEQSDDGETWTVRFPDGGVAR